MVITTRFALCECMIITIITTLLLWQPHLLTRKINLTYYRYCNARAYGAYVLYASDVLTTGDFPKNCSAVNALEYLMKIIRERQVVLRENISILIKSFPGILGASWPAHVCSRKLSKHNLKLLVLLYLLFIEISNQYSFLVRNY